MCGSGCSEPKTDQTEFAPQPSVPNFTDISSVLSFYVLRVEMNA